MPNSLKNQQTSAYAILSVLSKVADFATSGISSYAGSGAEHLASLTQKITGHKRWDDKSTLTGVNERDDKTAALEQEILNKEGSSLEAEYAGIYKSVTEDAQKILTTNDELLKKSTPSAETLSTNLPQAPLDKLNWQVISSELLTELAAARSEKSITALQTRLNELLKKLQTKDAVHDVNDIVHTVTKQNEEVQNALKQRQSSQVDIINKFFSRPDNLKSLSQEEKDELKLKMIANITLSTKGDEKTAILIKNMQASIERAEHAAHITQALLEAYGKDEALRKTLYETGSTPDQKDKLKTLSKLFHEGSQSFVTLTGLTMRCYKGTGTDKDKIEIEFPSPLDPLDPYYMQKEDQLLADASLFILALRAQYGDKIEINFSFKKTDIFKAPPKKDEPVQLKDHPNLMIQTTFKAAFRQGLEADDLKIIVHGQIITPKDVFTPEALLKLQEMSKGKQGLNNQKKLQTPKPSTLDQPLSQISDSSAAGVTITPSDEIPAVRISAAQP